jgi:hypothetical protein
MWRRDSVRSTWEEFARSAGLSRKAGSWYRRSDETIVVLTMRRASYGRQYFLSVGLVLRFLDADENPKDRHCQIRSRFDRLVPSTAEHRLNDLLDLEFALDDDARRTELLELLSSELLPLLDVGSTLDGLRSGRGTELVRRSTVTDDARVLLAAGPVT